jgi:hypothetical protein
MSSSACTTAEELKDAGNAAFAASRFSDADALYTRALSAAADDSTEIRGTLFANRSAARLALCDVVGAAADGEAAAVAPPRGAVAEEVGKAIGL